MEGNDATHWETEFTDEKLTLVQTTKFQCSKEDTVITIRERVGNRYYRIIIDYRFGVKTIYKISF